MATYLRQPELDFLKSTYGRARKPLGVAPKLGAPPHYTEKLVTPKGPKILPPGTPLKGYTYDTVKPVRTKYMGLEGPEGEPAMFGPVPRHMRKRGPANNLKSPYPGLQEFGPAGIPARSPLDLQAEGAAPLRFVDYGEQSFEPMTRWDVDPMDLKYREIEGLPTDPELLTATAEYGAPDRPAVTPRGVPVQGAHQYGIAPAGEPDPRGLWGSSYDTTNLNLSERLGVQAAMMDPDRRKNLEILPDAQAILDEGRELNKRIDQGATRGGFTRVNGMDRVNPVGLMGGGVTEEDRARTYYNRHTGRWTRPPEQRTEADLTGAQQNAVDRGMTLREDGTLVGAGAGGPGADPSARRRYMNYMDAGLPVSDELIEAAGGDRTALEYARMKRNERAEEMDSRQNRVEYNAAQRAMARRARMGEGPAPNPVNVRAFLGDQEARRSQNLGQAGLASVMAEEQKARVGLAEAAAQQTKADADMLFKESYAEHIKSGATGPQLKSKIMKDLLDSMYGASGQTPTPEMLQEVEDIVDRMLPTTGLGVSRYQQEQVAKAAAAAAAGKRREKQVAESKRRADPKTGTTSGSPISSVYPNFN